MAEKWSKNYEKCKNCGTDRFNYRARGYCVRCYSRIKKLEEIPTWNLSKLQTQQTSENSTAICNVFDMIDSPDEFEKYKTKCSLEIKKELKFLRIMEEKLNGSVSGRDIERQLQHIADQCSRKNKNVFHGFATLITDSFPDPKQRKILYKLLNKIEESIPLRRRIY